MKDRVKLFSLCFGDSEESARELFSIEDITTLTEYTDRNLCAMATLVPLECGDGTRGFYAYGVCVHPEYRGNGAFKRIMKSCEAYAIENGADFICLIPADTRLADTYARMGYTDKIALCHNADKDSERLFVLSEKFIEYATPDGDGKGPIPYGLMKPLTSYEGRNMAFHSPMGDS